LLSKANPLAPGAMRKTTLVKPKKEEEEPREKIRFDVFDEEDATADKYQKSGAVLNHVRIFSLDKV